MLMLGKISVGVRRMTTGAAIRIISARTMNVYGRLRATLTIHILFFCAPFCRDCDVDVRHRSCRTIGLAYAVLKARFMPLGFSLESPAIQHKPVWLLKQLSDGRQGVTNKAGAGRPLRGDSIKQRIKKGMLGATNRAQSKS
jgi:hypothetical protein